MDDALRHLAGAADRAGWDAHTHGRPDLRDTHWTYRDATLTILNHARKESRHMTNDDFIPIEVDDDDLIPETGEATGDELGTYDDNDDEGAPTDDAD